MGKKSMETQIGLLCQDVKYIKKSVDRINGSLDKVDERSIRNEERSKNHEKSHSKYLIIFGLIITVLLAVFEIVFKYGLN